MRRCTARLLLAAATAWAGAAQAEESQTPTRTIGFLLPPEAVGQAGLREGALLGVEHAAEETAVPARILFRGRVGQWGADAMEAAALVTDDGAAGLIAPPNGAASHLVLQVAGRTGTPVVTLCADASVSQSGIPWVARIVPGTVAEATALFGTVADPGAGTRWLAVVPDGRAGREIVDDLEAAASAAGHGAGVFLRPPHSDPDVLFDHVRRSEAGVVLLWLDPARAGAVAKALRAGGYAGTLAGPGRLDTPAFTDAAGAAAAEVWIAEPVQDAESEAVYRRFAAEYRDRFGRSPDATAAMSYDAARLLLHLLPPSGPLSRREAFPPDAALAGATGPLRFDALGNRIAELVLRTVRAPQGE